jgi:hypothetical protein
MILYTWLTILHLLLPNEYLIIETVKAKRKRRE